MSKPPKPDPSRQFSSRQFSKQWVRAVLLLLALPIGLILVILALDAVEVARTGLCPPLDALDAYPCSLSDYLTRELWRNDWLGWGMGVIFGLCWLIGLPLLLGLAIQSRTRPESRSWLAWAMMLSCFIVSSFFATLLISALVSSLISLWR